MERLAWAWAVESCLCGWLKVRGAPDRTEGTTNHDSMALLPAFPEDLEEAHCVHSVRVRALYVSFVHRSRGKLFAHVSVLSGMNSHPNAKNVPYIDTCPRIFISYIS